MTSPPSNPLSRATPRTFRPRSATWSSAVRTMASGVTPAPSGHRPTVYRRPACRRTAVAYPKGHLVPCFFGPPTTSGVGSP